MIGISYFAIAQIGAAATRPPRRKAVFPDGGPSLSITGPEGSSGTTVLPCRNPQAVPIGESDDYRIPLVPSARRFAAGSSPDSAGARLDKTASGSTNMV